VEVGLQNLLQSLLRIILVEVALQTEEEVALQTEEADALQNMEEVVVEEKMDLYDYL
jgi:hypothetical protein